MPKKIRQKIRWLNINFKQKKKGFLRCFLLSSLLLMANLLMPAMVLTQEAEAVSCPDVKIIFARGSGEERWTDQSYLSFKKELKSKLESTNISYEFEDLNYPAINVGNPLTLLTTFVSGGEAYEFGNSVNIGVKNLASEVNNSSCPNTKYVIGGYSQGAMVISKAIHYISADKVLYAATFGDPKLYLPEGAGAVPAACKGQNLSEYRIYVPDCRAYSGLLGGYQPYQPENWAGKLGTWCNKKDIFCSSYLSIKDHTSYVTDEIYADASKHVFDKITKAFEIENTYVSLHDTAILIDSTISMGSMIEKYKTEALRLAKETLESGGRVALYDYRDMREGYIPHERCNFETCTLETFQAGLDEIETDGGGGDSAESLLPAGIHVMKKLNWNYGSTKSVVVLTDANYHDPDIDGTSFNDVVNLSKSIDPVNFYFVVPRGTMIYYTDLAAATDGGVVSIDSDLSSLTDMIITRFDSLPRVEEKNENVILPEISDVKWEKISPNRAKLTWENTGTKTLVVLNDLILGLTDTNEIILDNLDWSTENIVTLVPLSETRRGLSTTINMADERGVNSGYGSLPIPKAPNTGKQ